MKEKFVTIPKREYERLLQMEDLAHRQRFMIARVEKQYERYRCFASRFSNKTLQILLGSGYTMDEIMLMYGKGVRKCPEN